MIAEAQIIHAINEKVAHPYVNQYVVVRTYASGVHVGYLKSYDAQTRHIFLTQARRIWRWEGAFTLSEVSQHGIKDGKLSMELPEIMISDVLEIIKCSDVGAKNLSKQPVYVPS